MHTQLDARQWLAIGLLIIIVATMRMLPHPDNFTPVGALGLFAGAFLSQRAAWLVPLGALLLGDAVIGFYALPVMLMVYLGFAAGTLTGRIFLAQRRSPARLLGAVFVSALIFYLLSNFAVWWLYYPNTWAGLVACYTSALPYFGRSLLGDLLYSGLLFGAFALMQQYWRRQQHA